MNQPTRFSWGWYCLFLALIFLFPSCEEDDANPAISCETVVNANGPAFLKVTNHYGDEVNVELTDAIPFTALIRNNACEIYGLPTGTHSILFHEENGSKSKELSFDFLEGEMVEVTVESNFF